jgi:hypothetical protein
VFQHPWEMAQKVAEYNPLLYSTGCLSNNYL